MFVDKKVTKDGKTFKKEVLEQGDKTWSSVDGAKRKQILESVGLEYKQINILASIIAEIIKANPELLSNPIIADGMTKFAEIEAIRNS
jgi:hypothetical protein